MALRDPMAQRARSALGPVGPREARYTLGAVTNTDQKEGGDWGRDHLGSGPRLFLSLEEVETRVNARSQALEHAAQLAGATGPEAPGTADRVCIASAWRQCPRPELGVVARFDVGPHTFRATFVHTGQVNLDEVASRYRSGMVHADNLVALHHRAGNGLRGKRYREMSLNRAVVVTAVATWQAAVQGLVNAILDSGGQVPQADPNWSLQNLLKGNVRNEVKKFSTPNSQNSERLLRHAGFDPAPSWTWPRNYARPSSGVYSQMFVKQRLDEWVNIRHAIAHGHDDLPPVHALFVVRNPHLAPKTGNPTLRLSDAKACVTFFHSLVSSTGNGVADHLGLDHPSWERPKI